MSKRQPPPPQIKSLPIDSDTRDILLQLVQRRIELKVEQDRLKAETDELNELLLPILRAINLRRVALEDWTCSIKPWSNSHISKDKLFDEGVSLDVIERCTLRLAGESIEARGPKDKD